MADQPVTREKLINADIDVENLGKALNELGVVNPRYGDPYPTLPSAIQEVIETGGFEPFATEAALLASVPILEKKASYALDTHKIFLWENGVWIDTGLSAKDQANNFTKKEINILRSGGQKTIAVKSQFSIMGYYNTTGTWVAGSSTSGYMTTDYIALDSSIKQIKVSLYGTSGASVVNFYDASKTIISRIVGNVSSTERAVTVPANTAFVQLTNSAGTNTNPYALHDIAALLDDSSLIKKNDLTIEPSLNLAKPSLIVNGAYVNNTGSISSAAGWKYIKIPVEAGQTYTLGRFVIDSAGYYAFYNASNALVAGSVGVIQNNIMPHTVTAPAGSAYLLLDIARPTNTPEHYAELTINVGSTLIDYVAPVDTIVEISGFKLKGDGDSGGIPLPENIVVQGDNATLADIFADSITTGALIANLPTSSTGLEAGQAYIDNGTIKVVM